MVKKLKYLLFLIPFFTILNVNAVAMPTPSFVNARFSDGSIETSVPGYSQVEFFASGQWYYKSTYLLGGVSSAQYVNRINYGWNNPNLCNSGSELEIKGSIAVIQDFFNKEQYDIELYSNGSKMDCNFNFDNTVTPTFAKLDFTCTGRSGGGMNLYIYQLSYHYNKTYMVGFRRDISYSCDVSNGAIIQNDNVNTQKIIDNQNSNTNKIIQEQQETTDAVNGLKDSMTSESQPNTNSNFNDFNGMVASNTPITDLITMPLTLVNAYINGMNSSCSPVNLGNLYGTDLTLPCINLEQRLGSNLWHIIDAFFSIFLCYNIGMLFITAFDGITSLRDDFEGLYQPRHADTGYQPKHGGGN